MFHPNGHLNKHGFFEVGQEQHYSKLDAILRSAEIGQPVKWNFNNSVFEKLDWTKEPETDIVDLYQQRAHQLREKYDYLVLMFSGGSDSTTVLQTFLDIGVHIDEIMIVHWISGEQGDAQSFINAEVTNAALPFLEKNKEKLSNTLVRIDDISSILRNNICDPLFRIQSMREVNNVHNLGIISYWHNLHVRHPEYTNCYNSGKTVGFVWAEEKPIIDYDVEQQKHVMCFEDHYGHAPQPRDQEANDPNCNYEFFFSSPDAPLIPIKQAHLLLKTLDQIRHRSDIFVSEEETQQVYMGKRGFRIHCPSTSTIKTFFQGKFYYLDRNAVNCTIYPGWNFLTYHDDKQYYRLDHPAYQWLMQSEPDACKAWYKEFIKTYGALPKEWKHYHGSLRKTPVKRLRIRYYLE